MNFTTLKKSIPFVLLCSITAASSFAATNSRAEDKNVIFAREAIAELKKFNPDAGVTIPAIEKMLKDIHARVIDFTPEDAVGDLIAHEMRGAWKKILKTLSDPKFRKLAARKVEARLTKNINEIVKGFEALVETLKTMEGTQELVALLEAEIPEIKEMIDPDANKDDNFVKKAYDKGKAIIFAGKLRKVSVALLKQFLREVEELL